MLNENVAVITLEEADERLLSPAPVLITEQQIALGTAAALRPRPTPRRRWMRASYFWRAVLHSARVPSPQDGLPKGRGYPTHYQFLEDACLAREMYHL
jgi:hypothetical protein